MTLDLSLGELQALCTKAARGAGRAVGVAEDAGHAVRWLCARELDGAGALVALLQATDGRTATELAPDPETLAAPRDALCPLALGAYLSDADLTPDGPVGPVHAPLLLRPFLVAMGRDLAPLEASSKPHGPQMVRLMACAIASDARATRAHPDADSLDALHVFAARTYAPATEASRAGAGSGLSDND
ncbi:DUF3726 domain-containing protein [Gymnodinialimonas ceratoperidinii]|uniref:DUF3726 domain-containing protein n=1 Tax=Gymnodinialimonas ceratoperidinii TaxID=2856823 RepID=A0A8F6YC52_9RHOB|nr:DUF3726 domain-containing protein [Gymnodinialimonas ceratoperidinii]QXT38920.1 DUF3726 domain-containing protein [Gymnodinialimonas ceratoperidinii]